jgi:glucokinase
MYYIIRISIKYSDKACFAVNKKEYIKREVLRWLSRDGRLTRAEFIRETGERAATVFEVVDRLKVAGIIAEQERKSKRTGRVSPEITFNGDYLWIMGLDFQFDKTIGVVTNLNGVQIAAAEIAAGQRNGIECALREITAVFQQLREELGENWQRVKAVGFADPGLVDIKRGISLKAVNINGWENFDTAGWLRQVTGIDNVLVYPETLVSTYMEYHTRLPGAPASLFRLNTGIGIGGGFIKDGKLFIGDSCNAMEIGHLVIQPEGPLCQCGNRGCLEAVAGESGIRRRIIDLIANGVNTELNAASFSLDNFCTLAQTDRAARLLAHELSKKISSALCTVVTLLNPMMIVIGGELSGLGDILLQTIRHDLSLQCLPHSVANLTITISTLDKYAPALGVTKIIKEEMIINGKYNF